MVVGWELSDERVAFLPTEISRQYGFNGSHSSAKPLPTRNGWVAERLKAPVLKTGKGE